MHDGLEWYPRDYVDETVPPARDSAQAWVERHGDGWRIAPANEFFREEEHVIRITDGEEVVFYAAARHGTATLTFADDGTWSVDREPPPGSDTINCDDYLAISETLEDIVEQVREYGEDFIRENSTFDLSYSTWTDHAFRFDAATGVLSPSPRVQ